MKPFVCLLERTRSRRHFFSEYFRNFTVFFVIEFVKDFVSVINNLWTFIGQFLSSLFTPLFQQLVVGQFCSILMFFLVASILLSILLRLSQLLVKNCPILVHKHLQNCSKTQYHRKCVSNLLGFFSDKKAIILKLMSSCE